MEDRMVTLASDVPLVDSYHKLMDPILNSALGNLIINILAALAVILMIALVIGGICRALGKQNALVQLTCSSIGRVVIVILVIFILAGPKFTLPLLMKVVEWAANALGNGASDYLGL